jgi:hypothetical protein
MKSIGPLAKRLYGWMDFSVMGDLPVAFCESKMARKYSNLEDLSRKTLSKYMDLVCDEVVQQIKKILPKTFGIIFDGWSNGGEHYTGTFVTWTNKSGGVERYLIAMGVQDLPDGVIIENADAFGFSADDIGDYLFDALSRYDRSFEAIEFLSGDNCSVNGALADKISAWILREKRFTRKIPLVGCASHRLNLAAQSLYKPPGSDYHDVVKKVNLLITELRTLKNTYKVAAKFKKTILKPNETRWSSTYSSLKRFIEFYPFITSCKFGRDVLLMVPDAAELKLLEELVEKLKVCNEVSVFLQQDDPSKVGLDIVRDTFDKLIAEFPSMARHLDKNAAIVHDKSFENAVVKVLRGKENTLTGPEKEAISIFRMDVDVSVNYEEEEEEVEMSFMTTIISAHKSKVAKKSNYRAMTHICATSNAVERLFSRAKLVITSQRGSMDPSTLETILLLRDNKSLWDVYLVQDIITKHDGRQQQESAPSRPPAPREYDDENDAALRHAEVGMWQEDLGAAEY